VLGRLGNPSSRAGATPPSERRRGGARGLDLVARNYLVDSLMPQVASACRTLTQLGLGLRDWEPVPLDRTLARDRWLNSSWTPSPGGTLNCPRGTSLEDLSGWIRIIGGPPARNARPAPTAAAYLPRRKATRMGATRTRYRPGRPTTCSPGGTSEPPGGTGLRRPHSGPGHGWSLPEPRESDHPADPGLMPAGPGWQALHRVQSVAICTPRPTH
jgi:hypothetical protein